MNVDPISFLQTHTNQPAVDVVRSCSSDEEEDVKIHPCTMTEAQPSMSIHRTSGSSSSCGHHLDAGFDLHQNYQNAVDCLVHCEFIMKNLQDELASKDQQIATLEAKLIQTKLELASSKAIQDEQSQQLNRLKRRLSCVSPDEDNGQQGEGCDLNDQHLARNLNAERQQPRHQQRTTKDPMIVNYAPISIRRNTSSIERFSSLRQ